MKRIAVESSQVKSVGYDPDSEVLEVEFKGGTVYQYAEVTCKTYADMMNADSIGRFLNTGIKGTHEYQRLDPKAECAQG